MSHNLAEHAGAGVMPYVQLALGRSRPVTGSAGPGEYDGSLGISTAGVTAVLLLARSGRCAFHTHTDRDLPDLPDVPDCLFLPASCFRVLFTRRDTPTPQPSAVAVAVAAAAATAAAAAAATTAAWTAAAEHGAATPTDPAVAAAAAAYAVATASNAVAAFAVVAAAIAVIAAA
jgi:hypothetical protein